MASRKPAAKSSSSKANKTRRPKVRARKGASKPSDVPKEIAVFDPDGVEKVFDVMPEEETLQNASDLLSGLSHPSRLKALIALSVSELCVGDIAAVVGLSLSATSTMLKQLRSLSFLATRSVGKQTYYRVTSELPNEVMALAFAAGPTED
ncbi:MAG: winged helix-turn-helix transcriptional regulator [Deltaproteobacteria bacterium]|nr:winged helix-turn-helix transcriptional regulator [Deltaproteobacteria bacterium]